MSKRRNESLNILILSVLGGIVIGTVTGILGNVGVFDGDIFLSVILTVMAALLIGLCLYPSFNHFKNWAIMHHGIQVEATILEVADTIASPMYYRPDEDGELTPIADMAAIPAMYVLRLSYRVQGRLVEREFPPTLERTARQLLPYRFEKGAVLPVICLEKWPQWAVIAIPGLFEETLATQKGTIKYGLLAAVVVLLVYFALLLYA